MCALYMFCLQQALFMISNGCIKNYMVLHDNVMLVRMCNVLAKYVACDILKFRTIPITQQKYQRCLHLTLPTTESKMLHSFYAHII